MKIKTPVRETRTSIPKMLDTVRKIVASAEKNGSDRVEVGIDFVKDLISDSEDLLKIRLITSGIKTSRHDGWL
jgi:hypothetical protein